MGRHFHSEVDIKSPWHQVLAAFWQRYPNPYSAHVLTEDVLYREVTPCNHLLSRRLLTKTNRLPGWAERVFPAHMARAVYVLEDSVVDPQAHTLTTRTWNLNHNTLMTVVESCVFEEDHSRPSWTKVRRDAWILSAVYGLARPIQEFGLSRFPRFLPRGVTNYPVWSTGPARAPTEGHGGHRPRGETALPRDTLTNPPPHPASPTTPLTPPPPSGTLRGS